MTKRNEPEGFAEFWAAYPRKVSRPVAARAFGNALKKASLSEMLAAIEAYKAHKPGYQDYCHPATWLNQERWLDEWETEGGPAATAEFTQLVSTYPKIGNYNEALRLFNALGPDQGFVLWAAKTVKASLPASYTPDFKETVKFIPALDRWIGERRFEQYRAGYERVQQYAKQGNA